MVMSFRMKFDAITGIVDLLPKLITEESHRTVAAVQGERRGGAEGVAAGDLGHRLQNAPGGKRGRPDNKGG